MYSTSKAVLNRFRWKFLSSMRHFFCGLTIIPRGDFQANQNQNFNGFNVDLYQDLVAENIPVVIASVNETLALGF